MKKSNAIRLLEAHKILYDTVEYDANMEVDGVEIAKQSNLPLESVYKTLVAVGKSGNHFVFVIPVAQELDLKKAAKAVGEKSVQMIHQKELLGLTGYIRGGVSPVGMKKLFPTIFQQEAEELEWIYVSGGQKGLQMKLSPKDLIEMIHGRYFDVIKE
ncbi:Cys-tRNA(Pro) deacylase [Peptoniphilus sp. KCTC 25270]|uniref:Cys-tRNA(Pro) deacylase n=1 Tax=Peptoniphilus sp. KCTC 25270 TaxID=2897414 RepID=UPI001E62C396|nr:Cys-tRNA(Pro) deacylase [Peptoniphilus sp. KCTC 25270]MCD1147230.1 Cys-tRNA(Pro) deacylase [Peptoniphilus sp. KCTC 25270]